MRHRKAHRKFGLPSDQRRALLKGLTRSLLLYDRIVTTETRAKEVRPIVEKLVTMARKGGIEATVPMRLHTRRQVRRYVDSNIDEFVRVPGGPRAERRSLATPTTSSRACSKSSRRATWIVPAATPVSSKSVSDAATARRWCCWSSSKAKSRMQWSSRKWRRPPKAAVGCSAWADATNNLTPLRSFSPRGGEEAG